MTARVTLSVDEFAGNSPMQLIVTQFSTDAGGATAGVLRNVVLREGDCEEFDVNGNSNFKLEEVPDQSGDGA